MKKRLFCTALFFLLSFSYACTEEEINSFTQGMDEALSEYDGTDLSEPVLIETDNNTETGDTYTDDNQGDLYIEDINIANQTVKNINTDLNSDAIAFEDSNYDIDSETELSDDSVDLNTSYDNEPNIEDYNIIEYSGEYVCIKSSLVRSGPSQDFDKLGQLNNDEVVVITGISNNGWFQFEFDSKEGYAMKKFFIDKETYDEQLDENDAYNEDFDKTESDEAEADSDDELEE